MADPIYRELWALSLKKNWPATSCRLCRKHLEGVEKWSSPLMNNNADAMVRHTSEFLVVTTFLHDSSPLHRDVFGEMSRGESSGQCPDCGRTFRYHAHPRGDEPGSLYVGKAEPGIITPQATSSEAESGDVQAVEVRYAPPELKASPEPGVLWWRPGLSGVSIPRMQSTAHTLWYDLAQRDGAGTPSISTTLILDPLKGELVSSTQYSKIQAADDSFVLTQAGFRRKTFFLNDGATGKSVWKHPADGAVWQSSGGVVVRLCPQRRTLHCLDVRNQDNQWMRLEGSEGTSGFSIWGDRIVNCTRSGGGRAWSTATGEVLWVEEAISFAGAATVLSDQRGWAYSNSSGSTVYDAQSLKSWSVEGFQVLCMTVDWVVGELDEYRDQDVWCRAPRTLSVYRRDTGERLQAPSLGDCGGGKVSLDGDRLYYLERPDLLAAIDLLKGTKSTRALPQCLQSRDIDHISVLSHFNRLFLYSTQGGDVLRVEL